MFRTRIALVLVASAAFGAFAAGSTASAAPGDGRCIVEALAEARAAGVPPREFAAQRGFPSVGAWLRDVRFWCGQVTEEPPGH